MRIQPYQNNTNFTAINQKYLKWAEREAKGIECFDELLFQIGFKTSLGKLTPQDAIDTLKAIREIYPLNRKNEVDESLAYVRRFLK